MGVHDALSLLGSRTSVVTELQGLVHVGLFTALVALLVRVRRQARTPRAARGVGVLAVLIFAWTFTHPGSVFEVASYLAAALLGGPALRTFSAPLRTRILAIISFAVLVQTAGPWPTGIVVTGMAAGLAALRARPGQTARESVLVQGAILLATFAASIVAFLIHPLIGLGTQGLFAFMLLRHVSWVVDTRRGAGGSLRDYWCYQLFYPSCYGSTERYGDFQARNPDLGGLIDDARLVRVAARGALYFWLSRLIPADLSTLLAPAPWPVFAARYFVSFVESSLFLMATWSILEASALAWGVRIHANFAGILAARSPSEFWYAWRGTMTRWLVEYVYIPLGGSRAHQVRNVFAVFAVSASWHWMGIPFLQSGTTRLTPAAFVPIGTWALVNAVVLAAALTWRRRGRSLWPSWTPAAVRSATARLGTWAFGGVTATFLAFQGPLVPRFPEFVLRLLGLG
jgi:hypothetical protein